MDFLILVARLMLETFLYFFGEIEFLSLNKVPSLLPTEAFILKTTSLFWPLDAFN